MRCSDLFIRAALAISSDVQEAITGMVLEHAACQAAAQRRDISADILQTRGLAFVEGYERGILPLSGVLDPQRDYGNAAQDEISALSRLYIESKRLRLIVGEREDQPPR